jgi:hypothetical protein
VEMRHAWERCWVFGKTNTCQDTDDAAMHYGARTQIIFHCLSSCVGALMKVKLIINK